MKQGTLQTQTDSYVGEPARAQPLLEGTGRRVSSTRVRVSSTRLRVFSTRLPVSGNFGWQAFRGVGQRVLVVC